MTEVKNYGGGHRTRLKINLCVYGVPPPPYIKEGRRRRGRPQGAHPRGGFILLVGIDFPHFLVQEGEEGKEERREGTRGGTPSPCPIQTPHGGAPPTCGLPCLSSMAHMAHYFPRGIPVTPRYSDKFPKGSGTIPVPEYYRPIYQSLPLDHFETPRHVHGLIRDSEQSLVTKTHNS